MSKKSCFILLLAFLSFTQCQIKTGIRNIPNGVLVEIKNLHVRVQFYSPDIVRVEKWLPETQPDSTSLVVLQEPSKVEFTVQEKEEQIVLASAKIKVIISKKDGSVEFTDDKNTILKEKGRAEIEDAGLKNEKAYHIKQNFSLTPEEGIYGFGQHQTGYMNYRGKSLKLVQTNTDAVTPFLISTNQYGILWDNYSKTIFRDTLNETSMWSDVANSINYYFIHGANMDSVISGYRQLTGIAPMYGKWAYGYWQSKEHYEDRNELLSVASEYRKRRIPIDNIIQDWDTWEGAENWNQIFFDPKKFPQPEEMIRILHKQNFKIIVSVWCSFGPNTDVYKDMEKRGFLYPVTGWAGFKYFDAYNPDACKLYWDYMNKGFFSIGMDGWWMDSTEPDIVNANTKEATEYEMKRVPDNKLGSFARYLNPYALVSTESVYKNQRKETDRKRVYILTRSTFAGQQRAAATTWSGDIGASWEIYKKQISAGINHCMAGIPYWTFDIGAFVLGGYGGVFGSAGTTPAYQELYTRMFQFGAFCPIFRSHGSEITREIWTFGDFSDELIKFDNLRYRLMPYIYSLASDVTRKNYTIMRGLPMDFAADQKTHNIDDQFMFGPSMMVCPVTEYMLHKPPMQSMPVEPEHFKTDEGKQGILVKYYKDIKFEKLSKEQVEPSLKLNYYATGRPEYVTDSTMAMKWKGKIISKETGKHQFHIKGYGPKRLYINGKLIPLSYQSVEAYTEVVELEAGKEYDFAFETENKNPGAFRMELYWKTPSIFAEEAKTEAREQTREVYLPKDTKWFDFWTGKITEGGQTVTSPAPIDKIPLFVKAGSIVPMGPFIQYASEKPSDPLEIRIYKGANGSFELYEDEGDNYDYEKGIFATINFVWDDAKSQLTIGNRKGSFPGMVEKRVFNIVIVKEGTGNGIEIEKVPSKSVQYNGSEQVVNL